MGLFSDRDYSQREWCGLEEMMKLGAALKFHTFSPVFLQC